MGRKKKRFRLLARQAQMMLKAIVHTPKAVVETVSTDEVEKPSAPAKITRSAKTKPKSAAKTKRRRTTRQRAKKD